MAKRGAVTELNHDNWDQEEESEEAGEFKKATDDQMKGRVIRKAKRRNLNEDQKKNVFAGFGGFTSTNVDAANAFSFLAKPANGAETKSTGFSFGSASATTGGSANGTSQESSGNGFVFGGASNGLKGGDTEKTPFSGFSFGNGETAKVKDAENEKANTESASKPSSDADAPPVDDIFAKFKNKSATTADPAPPPADDLFAKFMTKKAGGSWTCDICMISNDSTKDKCAACETPKPGAKVAEPATEAKPSLSFGEGGGFKFGVATSDPAPPPADDLFAKFMTKKAGGSWTCDICMISNDSTKDKCAACETPKPGAKIAEPAAVNEAKPSFSFGEGGGFKFGGAPTQTSNTLAGFKFGSGTSDDKSESNVGGFKFGSSEPSKPAGEGGGAETSSTMAGFKFGSSEASDSKSESNGGGFKFGSSEATQTVSGSGGFKFGTSEESTNPSKETSGIKFGSSEPVNTENNSGGFKFGSSSSTKTESPTGFKFGIGSTTGSKNDIFKSSEGGFKFSSEEKVSTKFNVEACDTPKTKSKKSQYLADLKALNIQVTNWIKSHVDGNPLVDLTPVFKDYEKHLDEMRKKFNVQASLRHKETDSKDNKEEKSKEEKETTEDVTLEPKPFSFGVNQSGFGNLSSGFGTSSSNFQFGFLNKANKTEETEETKSEEDDDSSPAKPAVETIVESDAIYSKKCKLYYKKEGAYVERGLGNVYLKQTEESKLQVIVRADNALGNILLNIIMTDDIHVDRVGKNNVMIICVPNPPIDPKADPEPVTFLMRVKTTEDADELKNKLNDLVKTEN